jgi:hypothetical protein
MLYLGGIRSHDPQLQSHRWQAEAIPMEDKTACLFLIPGMKAEYDVHN